MAQYKTLVTDPGVTTQLINATEWTLISIQRDTLGPVIIGNSPSLGPITAGRGVTLQTTPRYLLVRPGEALYVFSSIGDTVGYVAETLPFIVGNVMALLDGISKLASAVTGRAIVSPGKKC